MKRTSEDRSRPVICRFRPRIGAMIAATCALLAGGAQGQLFQRPPTVIENARIVTMDGTVIENGTIVIVGGRIQRVHAGGAASQERATKIDANGMTITPGLIDAWGTLGLVARSSGGNPNEKSSDGFNGYDRDAITEAWRNGVTAVYLPAVGSPGVNGVGAVMRLDVDRKYNRVGAVAKDDAALHIDLGSALSPVRRMANFQAVRERLKQAVEYRDARDLYVEEELPEYEKKIKERAEKDKKEGEKKEGDAKPAPPTQDGGPPQRGGRGGGGPQNNDDEIKKPNEPRVNRQAEIILKAIDRQLPVRIAADRAEDILNAIALKEEFGLTITIEGGAEAHLVARELAQAEVPVVLGSMVEDGRDRDAYRGLLEDNARKLEAAGVQWTIGSGGPSSYVLFNAQLAASAARDADGLELVTARAADLLGLNEHGRIAPGRQADLVFWSGDPRDPASRVERVLMNGQTVYERAKDQGGSQP